MVAVKLKRSSNPVQHNVIHSSSDCTCAFLLKIGEGIKFAKTVVAMGDEKELSSRGYLALGIGYSLLASEGNVLVILGTPANGLKVAQNSFQHFPTLRC